MIDQRSTIKADEPSCPAEPLPRRCGYLFKLLHRCVPVRLATHKHEEGGSIATMRVFLRAKARPWHSSIAASCGWLISVDRCSRWYFQF